MPTSTTLQEGGLRFQHTFQEKAGGGGAVGPIAHEGLYRKPYNYGTGDGTISQLYTRTFEIAAGAQVAVDLQADTDDFGIARGFSKIHSYYIEVFTDGGQVNVMPGATNPFLGFVNEDSDVAADSIPFMPVNFGCQAASWENGKAVTSSVKNIILKNPGAAAVKFELRFSGAKISS